MGVGQIAAAALLATALAASAAPPAQKEADPFELAAPKDFGAAVAAVERATGAKGGAIETANGAIPLAEGRSFSVESRIAERLLTGSHATFRKAGLYLFRYERAFGLPGEKDRLGLLAESDRNAVLRRIGTGSAHRGLTTERIVAWLDDLAKEEPFELTEIGADYVAGRFERSPKDSAAIARRSAELAPDLVAGRASTLALLAEEIRVNRTLYLIF
ncbi:MAG TPA: DUF4253 domain-containing protein [Anaeromyxobacter sp.]